MYDHGDSVVQSHPYFPQDAVVSGYAPNSSPLPVILGTFGLLIGVFLSTCVALAKWHSPAIKRADQLTVAWFALCELRHTFTSSLITH